MTLDEIMPGFSMDWVREQFQSRKDRLRTAWVDDIKVMNVERVTARMDEGSLFLYVLNHQTQLDYFLPVYAVLEHGLPYPRSIVGSNLNRKGVREKMWDFAPWGVIWHDRNDASSTGMRNYFRAVAETYSQEFSVLGFAEARRNRNIGAGPDEFKEGFFRVALRAQNALQESENPREIEVVCAGCKYDKIPEEGFFEKIDANGFESAAYFRWDLEAYRRWMEEEQNKGIARINFGEPVSLVELAGEGKIKERSQSVADKSRDMVVSLLAEM